MASITSSTAQSSSASDKQQRSVSLFEDGILTGMIGAAVVAIWFLILDTARGQMFFTPSLLGSVIFLGQSPDQIV